MTLIVVNNLVPEPIVYVDTAHSFYEDGALKRTFGSKIWKTEAGHTCVCAGTTSMRTVTAFVDSVLDRGKDTHYYVPAPLRDNASIVVRTAAGELLAIDISEEKSEAQSHYEILTAHEFRPLLAHGAGADFFRAYFALQDWRPDWTENKTRLATERTRLAVERAFEMVLSHHPLCGGQMMSF